MSMKIVAAFLVCLIFGSTHTGPVFAKSSASAKSSTVGREKKSAKVTSDTEGTSEGTRLAEPIEHIFRNPAVAAGLTSGARALDKSINTLFDSLFYSILDDELQYNLNEYSWIGVGLQRDLYTTDTGSYVVADRFRLGPAYQRELWRVDQTPINVGVNTGLEILQLYLRTDGQRIVDGQTLPTFRKWANNWFGLLPILEYILPPSFNPSELYDPWRLIYTPFTLPLSAAAFYKMPQGAISSYAVNGGVTLSSDMFTSVQEKVKGLTDGIADTNARMPYALYVKGDYRINVFRRGEHTAWIGLSTSRSIGQTLSFDYGSVYYILKGALAASYKEMKWIWGGVPIKILPVDVDLQAELSRVFDQVYEFDLRKAEARDAYERAVVGDFSKAYQEHLSFKEQGRQSGVRFHFTKKQLRILEQENFRNSFGFANFDKHVNQSRSEIEITDGEGKFQVLEMIQDTQKSFDDVLVGEEKQVLTANVELKVVKVVKDGAHSDDAAARHKNGDAEGDYRFAVVKDPMHLNFYFSIRDDYLRSDEYQNYLSDLNFVTLISVKDLPTFPRRDPADITEWRKQNYFALGEEDLVPHVPFLHLGKFRVQALVSIPYRQIQKILSQSEQQYWQVFSRVYNKDPARWSKASYRATMKFQGQWLTAFFTYPLRYVNLDVASIQAIHEIDSAIAALARLKGERDPERVLVGFYELFDTDYPLKLYRALLLLSDPEGISRRISFAASPKRRLAKQHAPKFKSLDGKVLSAGPAFGTHSRYERAARALAEFELSTPMLTREREMITSVSTNLVSVARSRPKGKQRGKRDRHKRQAQQALRVNLGVQGLKGEIVKVYFKLEEEGAFRAARKKVIEDVLTVRFPTGSKDQLSFNIKGTRATAKGGEEEAGGDSSIDWSSLRGDFVLTLMLSHEGDQWSAEKRLRLVFQGGKVIRTQMLVD